MRKKALVVARHRRHLIVEDDQHNRDRCLVRGRVLRPLVGDLVQVETQQDGTLFVAEILPRKAILTRVDSRGRPEGVAANITQIIVVVAPRPIPDWYLVDRYLAAAELIGADAVLVWNKSDLGGRDASEAQSGVPTEEVPEVYEKAGYRVFRTSAKRGMGLGALEAAMRGQRSTLVGQSGVGKSSLINALLGSDVQAVEKLSEKSDQGRHTTTTSTLHRLPGGGELIDSPGVRHYAPYIGNTARIDAAFREFKPYLGHCRFDDCRHDAEPGCAVKMAVDKSEIDARRYESYLKLRATLESLQ